MVLSRIEMALYYCQEWKWHHGIVKNGNGTMVLSRMEMTLWHCQEGKRHYGIVKN